MTKTELTLGVVTLVSSSINILLMWKFGGKQSNNNTRADAITSGTDKIVDSTNKLLERMDYMLDQEREHREKCEHSLSEHAALIYDLRKEIELLKKRTL
jgi:hypothetical protein